MVAHVYSGDTCSHAWRDSRQRQRLEAGEDHSDGDPVVGAIPEMAPAGRDTTGQLMDSHVADHEVDLPA